MLEWMVVTKTKLKLKWPKIIPFLELFQHTFEFHLSKQTHEWTHTLYSMNALTHTRTYPLTHTHIRLRRISRYTYLLANRVLGIIPRIHWQRKLKDEREESRERQKKFWNEIMWMKTQRKLGIFLKWMKKVWMKTQMWIGIFFWNEWKKGEWNYFTKNSQTHTLLTRRVLNLMTSPRPSKIRGRTRGWRHDVLETAVLLLLKRI